MAKRAYIVIDKQGFVRYKHVMLDAGHTLDAAEILSTVQQAVAAGK